MTSWGVVCAFDNAPLFFPCTGGSGDPGDPDSPDSLESPESLGSPDSLDSNMINA